MTNLVLISSTNKQENCPKQLFESVWSDIPEDVLGHILSYLYAGDEVIFRSVCKTWKLIARPPRSHSQLLSPFDDVDSPTPYLCSIPAGMCKFFHPIYNDVCYSEISPPISNCHLCFSGHGGLLLQPDFDHAFFFHLSTKQRIDLPELPKLVDFMLFTSPDRIVGISAVLFSISTYKFGENDWKIYDVDEHIPFEIPFCEQCCPVFHNGWFYCVDPKGCLIEFDTNDLKDPIQSGGITYTRVDFQLPPKQVVLQTFMLVKEEELLVVVLTKNDFLYVYRWDNSNKTLVPVQSLKDYILYISCAGSFSEKATIRETGNKIFSPTFFHTNGNYAFYSLTTRRYHSFSNDHDSHPTSFKISHLCNSFWFRPTLTLTCNTSA